MGQAWLGLTDHLADLKIIVHGFPEGFAQRLKAFRVETNPVSNAGDVPDQ